MKSLLMKSLLKVNLLNIRKCEILSITGRNFKLKTLLLSN